MKCRDIMTKNVKTCQEECKVKDAVQIMNDYNCGFVPVINKDNQLSGVVTDRDIAIHALLDGKDPEQMKIGEFMTKSIISAHPNDNIDLAIREMKENKVRRIPVVDDNNKVVGIISLGDVAVLSGEEHETFEALETISSPVSSAK